MKFKQPYKGFELRSPDSISYAKGTSNKKLILMLRWRSYWILFTKTIVNTLLYHPYYQLSRKSNLADFLPNEEEIPLVVHIKLLKWEFWVFELHWIVYHLKKSSFQTFPIFCSMMLWSDPWAATLLYLAFEEIVWSLLAERWCVRHWSRSFSEKKLNFITNLYSYCVPINKQWVYLSNLIPKRETTNSQGWNFTSRSP